MLIDPRDLVIQAEDELYRGTIPKEILSGLHMPFIEYRPGNYSGGSLVVGLIASVFFRLFVRTVFALKLTPLLFFTLALVFCSLTVHHRSNATVTTYFA